MDYRNEVAVMRNIFLYILILAFTAATAAAQDGFIVDSFQFEAPSGGSCDTVVASNTGATSYEADITDADTYFFVGHHFFDDANGHDICEVPMYFNYALGDISSKVYTAYIYTIDGSGNLDTLIATSANTITGNNSWSDSQEIFQFSPAVTFGLDYAVVVSTGSVDPDNYATLSFTNSGALSGLFGRWQSDGTRTSSGSQDIKAIFYE